jgi:hypothetical protein
LITERSFVVSGGDVDVNPVLTRRRTGIAGTVCWRDMDITIRWTKSVMSEKDGLHTIVPDDEPLSALHRTNVRIRILIAIDLLECLFSESLPVALLKQQTKQSKQNDQKDNKHFNRNRANDKTCAAVGVPRTVGFYGMRMYFSDKDFCLHSDYKNTT